MRDKSAPGDARHLLLQPAWGQGWQTRVRRGLDCPPRYGEGHGDPQDPHSSARWCRTRCHPSRSPTRTTSRACVAADAIHGAVCAAGISAALTSHVTSRRCRCSSKTTFWQKLPKTHMFQCHCAPRAPAWVNRLITALNPLAKRAHGVPKVRHRVRGKVPKCPTSAHHFQWMSCNDFT